MSGVLRVCAAETLHLCHLAKSAVLHISAGLSGCTVTAGTQTALERLYTYYKLENVSSQSQNYRLVHMFVRFCLRRLFPNKNCALDMCNIPFYSFLFPLSNLFGIFWTETIVSSWEKLTFPTTSPLRVQSRLQSCRDRPKHLFHLWRRSYCWKKSPKVVCALQARQF
jgi:hypothetical protein